MIDKTTRGVERTGALVCKTIGKCTQGLIPVRMINTTNDKLIVYKGSLLGLCEPIVQLNEMIVEEETQFDVCTCNCSCVSAKTSNTDDELLHCIAAL